MCSLSLNYLTLVKLSPWKGPLIKIPDAIISTVGICIKVILTFQLQRLGNCVLLTPVPRIIITIIAHHEREVVLTKVLGEASFHQMDAVSLCDSLPDGHCIYCESKLSAIFSAFNEHESVKPFMPFVSRLFFIHLLAFHRAELTALMCQWRW